MESQSRDMSARRRFGGTNGGAAFFGWIVALGLGSLITTLLSLVTGGLYLAGGGTANALADNAGAVGLWGAIALLIVLGLSYYAGGYVAGRMSRFDGARQGRGVWYIGLVITVVALFVAAVAGASSGALQQLSLPGIPAGLGDVTASGVITLVLALVVSYLAATAGGRVGVGYHRKVDRQVASDDVAAVASDPATYAGRSLPTFGETVDNRDVTAGTARRAERRRLRR